MILGIEVPQSRFWAPPQGCALFYLKGDCRETAKLAAIHEGFAPLVLLQLFGPAWVCLWPALMTRLPPVAHWRRQICPTTRSSDSFVTSWGGAMC